MKLALPEIIEKLHGWNLKPQRARFFGKHPVSAFQLLVFKGLIPAVPQLIERLVLIEDALLSSWFAPAISASRIHQVDADTGCDQWSTKGTCGKEKLGNRNDGSEISSSLYVSYTFRISTQQWLGISLSWPFDKGSQG